MILGFSVANQEYVGSLSIKGFEEKQEWYEEGKKEHEF